jgi:hypothetical protein
MKTFQLVFFNQLATDARSYGGNRTRRIIICEWCGMSVWHEVARDRARYMAVSDTDLLGPNFLARPVLSSARPVYYFWIFGPARSSPSVTEPGPARSFFMVLSNNFLRTLSSLLRSVINKNWMNDYCWTLHNTGIYV